MGKLERVIASHHLKIAEVEKYYLKAKHQKAPLQSWERPIPLYF